MKVGGLFYGAIAEKKFCISSIVRLFSVFVPESAIGQKVGFAEKVCDKLQIGYMIDKILLFTMVHMLYLKEAFCAITVLILYRKQQDKKNDR